jgi:hypothetical protein
MLGRRYTVVIADRSSGVLRRVTISVRGALMAVAGTLMLPILIGLGARWSAHVELDQLRASNTVPGSRNAAATARHGRPTTQIQSSVASSTISASAPPSIRPRRAR